MLSCNNYVVAKPRNGGIPLSLRYYIDKYIYEVDNLIGKNITFDGKYIGEVVSASGTILEVSLIGEIKDKDEIEEKSKQYQEKKNRYDELMKLSVKVKEYELKLEQEKSKLKEINIEFDNIVVECGGVGYHVFVSVDIKSKSTA